MRDLLCHSTFEEGLKGIIENDRTRLCPRVQPLFADRSEFIENWIAANRPRMRVLLPHPKCGCRGSRAAAGFPR
jgi:hypothetical protein